MVELSESTRTSAEAAAAIGCEVEEIAKSIVFYVKDTLRPILVIASGTNRVDEKKLKKLGFFTKKLKKMVFFTKKTVFGSNIFLMKKKINIFFGVLVQIFEKKPKN